MDATRNGAFITEEEQREILQANQSGSTPVVFVHGLWLLPSSWDRWADLFRRAGYATLTPGWPYGPETIEEAKAKRKFFKGMPIGEVADHFEQVIGVLNKRPVIIGHSFGGLLTEILAGRGLAAASVASAPRGPVGSCRCSSRASSRSIPRSRQSSSHCDRPHPCPPTRRPSIMRCL